MDKSLERFYPNVNYGLSTEQVNVHIQQGCTNAAVESPSKSVKEIIFSNICTYFNLIFAIISVFLILVGSYRDLSFLPIIIANTLIGIIQEIRSKRTLDKLSVLNAPKATVIRDGKEHVVAVEDLVLDDIVLFTAGNQISADAVVMDGEVRVNEALITGEQDEITKKVGDSLLSGSYIVSGRCRAMLTQVGANSYASKLTIEAKKTNTKEQSEMIRSLNMILKGVGILIIPIAIVLFIQQYHYLGLSMKDSVTSTVAAIIGMIPEGLYLLTSTALVVSVQRLARKKVLVHDMKCIETLARVNVLCVDKTGTITENKMTVSKTVELDGYDSATMPALDVLMSDFTNNMINDNETMNALSKYFKIGTGKKATHITSFSSATKYSSVTFEDAVYVLGAPEFVLRDQFDSYAERINQYGSNGYRVLVFGQYDGVIDGKALTGNIRPLGLVLLSNPIRKEAKETFKYFAEQQVEIKVISGDNPVTVSNVAIEAGIANAENYVDARTLNTSKEISDAVQKYTVFGRVTPNQKRLFVQALKENGNTVAMTGDGVNDVLALKDADCSIAMASGSDVAAQAAQLVLLESNFACLPSVVLEGRRVINNIERSASLFLVKNIFSILMAVFSIIFMVNYPLKPSQISLISMFTIGIPAFFLALENNKNPIQGKFISNVLYKAFPAGLTDFIIVGSIVMFGQEFQMSNTDISTSSTLLMSIVGFMILYSISKPLNRWRRTIFITMMVGLLFCSTAMSHLFSITDISTKSTMLLVVFAIASEAVFRYATILTQKLCAFSKIIFKRMKNMVKHELM
ncbi:MAG: cation-translocating P-type ATPase [Clostridiales bacterium]|nr:cation-translocating P-type ATPase [Clostridiales bacterium]